MTARVAAVLLAAVAVVACDGGRDEADVALDPCASPACDDACAVPIDEARGRVGATVKVAGAASVATSAQWFCPGGLQAECETPIVLEDATGELPTRSETFTPWACYGDPTGSVDPSCVPLTGGNSWQAWGVVEEGSSGPRLVVQGYCPAP